MTLMTRLTPPPQQARLLVRQRVDALLSSVTDYPLTLLVAPAGSGKTTALASFATRSGWPMVWCRMLASDDPITLLLHIVAAFQPVAPIDEARIRAELTPAAEPPHAANNQHDRQVQPANDQSMERALDMLVNELTMHLQRETLLVLDDYHQADQKPELRSLIERLITIQPVRLHVLLATRYEPMMAFLPTVRARGEVYEVHQSDLAFTVEEAHEFFVFVERPIPNNLAELTIACRGWPLAMQMLASEHLAVEETEESFSRDLKPEPADISLQDAQFQGITTSDNNIPVYHHHIPLATTLFEPLPEALHALNTLLDEYLTRQVFQEQPSAIQEFLLLATGLRWFDKDVCAALPDLAALVPRWSDLERRRLFCEPIRTGQLVFQPLFRAYLKRMAQQQHLDLTDLHRQAADYYQTRRDYEGMIHHLLELGDDTEAASVLEQASNEWLQQGRASAILAWLELLPPSHHSRPLLLEAQAAANRRLANFEEALRIYERAEAAYEQLGDREGQARSLRGRAEVYLDTVQPAPAVVLLKQALKLLPRHKKAERAAILRLQAENWANRGRADVALLLETSARQLVHESHEPEAGAGKQRVPSEAEQVLAPQPTTATDPSSLLLARLLLRSGRLNESRIHLESDLKLDVQPPLDMQTIQLGHRQPSLLLALVYAMLGYDAKALAMARRGLLEAHQRGSKLTEAIAHMRVGHAYQVVTPLDAAAANRHYRQALELVQSAGVTRTRVEGYMGLALLYGHSGDVGAAEVVAHDGLKIAEEAGDEWIVALLWLALGSAAVAMNDTRALEWLDHAHQRFIRGGDSYGQAVVALWLALWHLQTNQDEKEVHTHVARLLELTRNYGYEGLLTAPTLFGPRDMAMLIPLLLAGRSMPEHVTYVQQMLRQAFPSVAADDTVQNYHPGYTIRIQMLGTFRVWRGNHEIQAREWQREKARQLLQLLLTYRGQWLQREQICAWLWPDSDLEAAERQFKVTLNALNTALEPLRPARTTPFFVRRQGLAYSFAPSYGCWIDVDEFELRTANFPQSDPDFVLRNSQIAVQLYKGDYLVESLYDSWTLEERERLLARYLGVATSLAAMLVDRGEMQQAVHLCERVLRRERCYEEAYQVLMRAYAGIGSRIQAMRTYTRCVQAMQDELGIEPLPETTELYERIKRNERV